MIYDGLQGIVRVLVVGTLAYAGLVFVLRLTGKRTLSKMNAFDLVVTVALGSTLATVLLSRDVALLEGLTALTLLCLLQYAVASASVRSERFQSLVKAEPRLLYHDGGFLDGAMRGERVTRAEVLAAVRSSGKASLEGVRSVVLETDGSFSIVTGGGPGDAMRTVRGARLPRDANGSPKGLE